MRNQYTVSAPGSGVKLPPRKTRTYPDSLNCEHCGNPFKPTKDRRRFCSKQCFHDWEKAKALEARPFGRPGGRAVKQMSAHSVKQFRKLDNSFAERCQFWMAEFEKEFRAKSNLSGRREIRLPLVLTGHGISINIESGALFVRDGLTHFPQERDEYRYFPGKHNTPSRIIMLGRSGSISIDAMCWLSAQNIPLVILDYQGSELSCMCSSNGISDYEVRIAQLLATKPETALELAKGFVRAKLAGQLGNLDLWSDSQSRRYAEYKLKLHLEAIETIQTNGDLLTLEATAALSYFKLWQELPLNWSSKSVSRIPPDWFAVEQRQSKVSGENRNANHPVNAILNYGYAVLESQVRIACAMFGFDTSVSYLHAMKHGRPSLIFDLIEPLRPKLDRRLIDFIRSETFASSDFMISIQGVCKLNPQLARRIVSTMLPDLEVQEAAAITRDRILGLMESDSAK